MNKIYVFLCFSLIAFSCSTERKDTQAETEKPQKDTKIQLVSEAGFPKNWIGNWKGDLKIDNLEKDTVINIPMELNISPSETNGKWNWQLVYNGSPREYELVAYETAKGHFKMDEKNTIVLDQQLFDNVFISRYDVAGNLLMVTNRLIGDQMLFEVIFSRKDSINTTGGEGEVPEVKSYPITVYQQAVLEKTK